MARCCAASASTRTGRAIEQDLTPRPPRLPRQPAESRQTGRQHPERSDQPSKAWLVERSRRGGPVRGHPSTGDALLTAVGRPPAQDARPLGARCARGRRGGRGVRSSLLSLLLILLTTVACQGLLPTPAPPTPTPLLLTRATVTENAAAPTATASPAAQPVISTPATPTQQPVAEATPTAAPPASAARLMAVGRRASIVLRAGPAANAAVLAQPAGSTVLWVDGRTADSRWLWVSYGDAGGPGLRAGDVQVFDGLATVARRVVTHWRRARPPGPGHRRAPTSCRAPSPAAAATAVQPALTGKIAFQTAPGGGHLRDGCRRRELARVTYGLDPRSRPLARNSPRWDAPTVSL